jgi:general secretion pathway protein A
VKPLYGAHFGLPEAPFSLAPDPRFLYLSPGHEEALAHLRWGLAQAGAFVVLTGEVGTGKSTVLAALLEDLPESTAVAYVLNPRASVPALLSSIARDFGFTPSEASGDAPDARPGEAEDLMERLYAGLLRLHGEGKEALLLIDEAQLLSPEALEQLRLLTNLETRERKLLQIILVGQPELRDTLARAELRQLAQRITARYHLEALGPEVLKAMLCHRLAVAGALTQPFSAAAFRELHRQSGGIPRIANLIADRALLAGYGAGQAVVDSAQVKGAAREVRGNDKPTRRPGRGVALAALLLLSAAALLLALKAEEAPKNAPAPMLEARETPPTTSPEAPPLPPPPGFSRRAGLERLLALWQSPTPAAPAWDCPDLATLGLACEAGARPLWQLLAQNRPALLGLTTPERWILLTAAQGTALALDTGEGPNWMDRRDLEAQWNGQVLLLWQEPPAEASLKAEWLAERLGRHGYSGPRGLQRFQADRGLAVGEALTVETVLALNEGVPGIPRLTDPILERP